MPALCPSTSSRRRTSSVLARWRAASTLVESTPASSASISSEEGPAHDVEPDLIGVTHRRAQGLLGDDLREYAVGVGLAHLGAQGVELGVVAGDGIALAGQVGCLGGVGVFDQDQFQLHPVAGEKGLGVARAGAVLDGADRLAAQLHGTEDVGAARDHEALAVVVEDADEGHAEIEVAGQGPGGVAREQVHLTLAQGIEAIGVVQGTKVTLSALPRTAAATARQKSASSRVQSPAASLWERPGSSPLTPQRRVPRAGRRPGSRPRPGTGHRSAGGWRTRGGGVASGVSVKGLMGLDAGGGWRGAGYQLARAHCGTLVSLWVSPRCQAMSPEPSSSTR